MCLSLLDVVEGRGWFHCEYFMFISIQKKEEKAPLKIKSSLLGGMLKTEHQQQKRTSLHPSEKLKTLLNRSNQTTLRLGR